MVDAAAIVRQHPFDPDAAEWIRPPRRGHVAVVPADPAWPAQFAELRDRIRAALGDAALSIEHVGSTAVPGLPAKPVIDIDLTVADSADEAAYIPMTTMVSRLSGRDPTYGVVLSFISVEALDERRTSAANFQITNLLRQRHRILREDDFVVRSQKEAQSIVGTITGGLTLMLAAIAAVSLLVGGIGIMNIMLVSVTERTREIGIRLAIGALGREVLLQFLIEAVVLAALGGLIGILIATAASLAITQRLI